MQPSLTRISAPLIDFLGSVLYDIKLPVATEDARYSGGVLFVSVPDVRHRRHTILRTRSFATWRRL